MLRFFRQIRQKLLENGNLRKYFWYALGEIFLVMIGILLALQINNWNEERKQEEEAIRVLSDFANTIESNVISDPAFHLMPNIQLDSIHYYIFNKSLKPDILDNSRQIDPRDLIIDPMFTQDFSGWFYNENIKTILENERQFPESLDRFVFYVRRLNAAFETMKSFNNELQTSQRENQRYLRTKDWMYKTDEESFKKRIAFYHTDTRFRNHLRSFQELNEGLLQQFEVFIKYQMFTWIEYQNTIEEKNLTAIFEQIEEAGYKRAEVTPCSEEFEKTLEEGYGTFYMWYPVFNNTLEPIEIYHRNPVTNENYVFATIEPGEYSGSATSRDFPYLQVGTNNTCERQYEVGWDKVVIINP
jgi:hypothetical protein